MNQSDNSGKALTVFLVIIAVLLVCLSGISVFFFLKEVDLRKSVEYSLEQAKIAQAKLEGNLKESQQQAFLLEEKYKEAKQNLENLQDDLELAQGVKQKMQEENKALTDERNAINAQLAKSQEQIASLKTNLDTAKADLDVARADFDTAKLHSKDLEEQLKAAVAAAHSNPVVPQNLPESVSQDTSEPATEKVTLEKIVVAPGLDKQGKVISVDAETGFLIASLGERHGIAKGAILSVYRNSTYLGDVQVSRVLPEMSAADFIPPLNGHQVSKDDQVIVKQ